MNAKDVGGTRKKVSVFYSWQSDSVASNNRSAIQTAIKSAVKHLANKGVGTYDVDTTSRPGKADENLKFDVKVDQAANGIPGSPKIPDEIIKKINSTDIFIADISIVNPGTLKYRRAPNPNVMFELGYAAAVLGWERVVLVINKSGAKRWEVPFDIQGHRYVPYDLSDDTPDRKTVIEKLGRILAGNISSIAKSNPPRPSDLRGKTKDELQREHDVRTLASLFSNLSIPILEQHLATAPDFFHLATATLRDEFNGIFESVSFHLNDPQLSSLVNNFDRAFGSSIPGDDTDYYQETSDQCVQKFITDRQASRQGAKGRADKAHNALAQGVSNLRVALREILKYVRENFPELNVDELGRSITAEIGRSARNIRRASSED